MTARILKDNSRAWFEVEDVAQIPSPSLLVYPNRVEENLRRMLAIIKEPSRLRPHIKTHKMRELVQMQLDMGITKFKCATIAEAEMAAGAGARDVLLAYQPVGPNVERVAVLVMRFPQTSFSVVSDDSLAIEKISLAMQTAAKVDRSKMDPDRSIAVLLDLDVGQHRTGISIGPEAVNLYRLIAGLPGLTPGGFHAYDGHLSQSDAVERAQACDVAFRPVAALKLELINAGLSVPRIVAGGTPTFSLHARRPEVECSPGTCIFWDAQYAAKLPDMDFLPAALVLTRIISKPGRDRICLDLGHKAIASEMTPPRVKLLGLEDSRPLLHSEEHLLLETPQADKLKVGDCFYGVPWHICPTVALYNCATVIRNGRSAGTWNIARERRLNV